MNEWLGIIGAGNRLFGFDLIENSNIPEKQQKLILSDDVIVSDEYRNEFNQWLKDRFGSEVVMYQSPYGIVANPEVVAMLKAAIR